MTDGTERDRVERALGWMREQSGDRSLDSKDTEWFLKLFDFSVASEGGNGALAQRILARVQEERRLAELRDQRSDGTEGDQRGATGRKQPVAAGQDSEEQTQPRATRPGGNEHIPWLDQEVKSYRGFRSHSGYNLVKRRDKFWELGLGLGLLAVFLLVTAVVSIIMNW